MPGFDASLLTAIAIIGHAANSAISLALLVETKVPYPGLLEESYGLQVFVYLATFSFECIILLTNLAEKLSSRINTYRRAICRMYFLCLLGLILLALTGIIGFGIIFGNDVRGTVEETLYKQVTEFYGMPDYADVTVAVNALQINGKCCGAVDYADFFNSSFASLPKYGGRVLPVTCFKIPEDGCTNATSADDIDKSKIYIEGCTDALTKLYTIKITRIIQSVLNLINSIYDGSVRTVVLKWLRPDEYKVGAFQVAMRVPLKEVTARYQPKHAEVRNRVDAYKAGKPYSCNI